MVDKLFFRIVFKILKRCMSKKIGDDFQALIEQIEKNNSQTVIVNQKPEDVTDSNTKAIIDMSPDKKSKLLRLMEKVSQSKEKMVEDDKKK